MAAKKRKKSRYVTGYVIIKSSRTYTGGPGYQGPAVSRSTPEVFKTKYAALRAAKKATANNPVGFDVYEHKKRVAKNYYEPIAVCRAVSDRHVECYKDDAYDTDL
ncbi:MAG: hypothetical protein JSV86_10330 [Gemmatimonadota bacterium]|nr:MAG: hypothetical protein JSV86_10330 [Gemmatimonadota bacterium]